MFKMHLGLANVCEKTGASILPAGAFTTTIMLPARPKLHTYADPYPDIAKTKKFPLKIHELTEALHPPGLVVNLRRQTRLGYRAGETRARNPVRARISMLGKRRVFLEGLPSLGIDQGLPHWADLEHHRRSPDITAGLRRAGFAGGWL
jgi:hypothetical protein